VLDMDTGARTTVQRGGFSGRYVRSGHLLYTNSGTLFALPFDIEALQPTGSAVPISQDNRVTAEGASDWSVSDNGTLVYRTGAIFIPRHLINWLDEGEMTPLWGQAQTYAEPRLSPDGTRLAVMILEGDNWDLWTYDITRDVATRLTFDPAFEGPGIWSPDGREIVYSSDEAGTVDLYRRPSDGSGEPTRLTESEGITYYVSDWSSDGRYVIFTADSGGASALMYLDLESDEGPQVFLPTGPAQAEAVFSPDGRWVAYQSGESGRNEVYVRPFPPAGGKWQVSDAGGGYPHWAADGRTLYYRTDEGIAAVSTDGAGGSFSAGRPRIAARGAFQGGTNGMPIGGINFAHYSVAPDGRFVVFPDVERAQNDDDVVIRVMTNFYDELRRRAPANR